MFQMPRPRTGGRLVFQVVCFHIIQEWYCGYTLAWRWTGRERLYEVWHVASDRLVYFTTGRLGQNEMFAWVNANPAVPKHVPPYGYVEHRLDWPQHDDE